MAEDKKNLLSTLKKKFSPEAAMANMVESMLPQLGQTLQAMEKSKEEGGLLPEGFQKMAYVIVQVDGIPKINIHPIKVGDETIMGDPVTSVNIKDLV